MNKIGIDLDAVRFYNMTLDQMEDEFKLLREQGISAINIDYGIFIDDDLEMFRNNILKCINYTKMQVILRSKEIEGYYTEYINDEQYQKSLIFHKQFLYNLYDLFEKNEIKTDVKIIFSGSRCLEGETQKTIEKNTWFFRELASSVEEINFEILTEVQGAKPTRGRVVGDTWDDFVYMCRNIPNKNWGICWSTGNSRLNFVEYNEDLIPSEEVLNRIKLANIRNNISKNFDISIYKNEVQEQEIKALVMNNYAGMFNMEYIYAYLEHENIPYQEVYDGIYYLRCVLNYFTKKNKENALEIADDVYKMNRHSIRTIIDNDIRIVFTEKGLSYDKVEIATHSLKIWSDTEVIFEDKDEYEIEIYYKNEEKISIKANYMMTRVENGLKGYVFKILNKETEIMKRIYRLVYLVE